MNQLAYILLIWTAVVGTAIGQTNSAEEIERQQEELRREQLRLQAKQDSLQKVQEQLAMDKNKQQQTSESVERKEDIRYNKTVIALHPLLAFAGQADFSIEQAVSKTSSLYLEYVYHDFNLRSSAASVAMPATWVAYSGYRVELQYRYYAIPEARALYKLYVAPHFYFKQNEVSRGEGKHYGTVRGEKRQYEYYRQYMSQSIGAGLNIGYQIQFLKHLTFDSFVGASYSIPLRDNSLSDIAHLTFVNPYREGMTIRMNFSIGFAF